MVVVQLLAGSILVNYTLKMIKMTSFGSYVFYYNKKNQEGKGEPILILLPKEFQQEVAATARDGACFRGSSACYLLLFFFLLLVFSRTSSGLPCLYAYTTTTVHCISPHEKALNTGGGRLYCPEVTQTVSPFLRALFWCDLHSPEKALAVVWIWVAPKGPHPDPGFCALEVVINLKRWASWEVSVALEGNYGIFLFLFCLPLTPEQF